MKANSMLLIRYFTSTITNNEFTAIPKSKSITQDVINPGCYSIENYAGGILVLGITRHSMNCFLICRGRLMTRLACNGPLAPGSWPWVPKTTPPGSTPFKGSKTSKSTAWEDTTNQLSEYFSTRTSVFTL